MPNAKIVNTPSQAIPFSGTSHTQTTIGSSAAAICSSLNANTTHVLAQFTGAACRVTFDGTNPTTSKGFIYEENSTAYWTREMALAAKGIRDDATDVVVEWQQLGFL